MRTDVQQLIAALTTERDSLTRAIEGLKQIRTGEPDVPQSPRYTKPRVVSAEGRARMAAAARERWARRKAANTVEGNNGASASNNAMPEYSFT